MAYTLLHMLILVAIVRSRTCIFCIHRWRHADFFVADNTGFLYNSSRFGKNTYRMERFVFSDGCDLEGPAQICNGRILMKNISAFFLVLCMVLLLAGPSLAETSELDFEAFTVQVPDDLVVFT